MRTPRGTETDWHTAVLDSIGATSTQQATKPAPRGPMGTEHYPLSAQIADTVATHGAQWALAYYRQRLPHWQASVFLATHCGG